MDKQFILGSEAVKFNWFKDKAKDKVQSYKVQKKERDVNHIFKNQTTGDAQVIFNPTALSWLFVAVTLFLQIISLATTYAGSEVYFGGIHIPLKISAPFLFAFSVQVTVFALSNSLKKNFRKWVIASLVATTFCSTYFSYIGIYNYVNSPLQYLEERYTQIQGNMKNQYNIIVDNAKTAMKEYVFEITNSLQNEYAVLTKKTQEYEALSKKVSNIKVKESVVNANTNSIARPNMSDYSNNLAQYYKDMASYNAAVINSVGEASQSNSKAQSAIYENSVKTVLGGKSLEEFTNGQIKVASSKENLENLVDSMHNMLGEGTSGDFKDKLNGIQKYLIDHINTGKKDMQIFNTVLTNMYSFYSNINDKKSINGFKEALNNFLVVADISNVFMKPLDIIRKEVYLENNNKEPSEHVSLKLTDSMLLYSKIQAEINKGAYTINSLGKNSTPIDTKSEEYNVTNMYVLPIRTLFSANENLAMAWICLGFAALIDGLTLLLALMHRNERSVLFAKHTKDLINKNNEFTEELLISSLVLHPIDDTTTNSDERSLEHLARFLMMFSITNVALEEGFSLYAPLEKLKKYHVFLATLCQFNFAKIISQEEFRLLENSPSLDEIKQLMRDGSMNNFSLKEKEGFTNSNYDRKIVLLKSKFVIWVNQKFTNILSNEELSHKLANILQSFGQEEDELVALDLEEVCDSKEVYKC